LRSKLRYDVVLARFGEIGLKSRPVRRRFEQTLKENIERAFESQGLDGVVQGVPGRLLVSSSDLGRARDVLARIFGLTSVSLARIVPSDLPTLLASIPVFFDQLAAQRPAARTFALRVRRSGQHPYSSQDVARQGGGTVLDRPGGDKWRVDLTKPDIEVFIEVRDRQAFLFHERTEAPGGLPVGTQGKVVVLLKDLNSLIAAWLLMKRGCTLLPVTFTGPTGQVERARAIVDVLRSWYFRGDLVELPHEETRDFPEKAACVLCMRQMIRKAGLFARRKKAKAIVTGEAFTSTTVESLTQFGGLVPIPLLRPVLGMTPGLVAGFAQRIGVDPGRTARFVEACPMRVPGRVETATVHRLEAELGLEVRAFEAVRPRATASVRP
jgi:tRNA uracil 4-sulfurtransferase